jgi:hypothetical protein
MSFFLVFLAAVVIFALCLLGMAVGVIFRNKPFRSCGNASIRYRGERIDCPACTDPPDECRAENSRRCQKQAMQADEVAAK